MRLKKIRLVGFKSFVDPTNIPFPGDMTAVVGPNGCGKSNVIDAVRWVLGESSAKNLRGDAMTDVIFNGSSARKPVSQCSVELVFDNTSGRIQGEFAAYNEISVKRVVTKDAVSSYFLNSSKCRRKDITDLFLGTGLGPRSYAIIEQGMISKLIESKPQELRVFIEEAAGISKYKERRKETHTRIKHTKENLERLEDVRKELGEQIAKLKRQALAATRYKELKQQERQLKAELATLKWLEQSRIMADAQDIISEKQEALDKLLSNQQGDESGLQALKNQQSFCKQSIDDLQQRIFALGTEITKLEQSQLFAQKRASQIQSEIEQLKLNESSLNRELTSIAEEIAREEEKRIKLEPEKELLQEKLYELEDKKQEADSQLEKQLRRLKEKEDAYYSKTQLLQQKHGQIQQTLSLQERTQTRLNELNDELSSLQNDNLLTELETLSAQRSDLDNRLSEAQVELRASTTAIQALTRTCEKARAEYESSRNVSTNTQAKVDALTALQSEIHEEQAAPNEHLQKKLSELLDKQQGQATWQYFEIQEGAEKIFNSALQDIEPGSIIDASIASSDNWPSELWPHFQKSLLFKQSFTTNKVPGTLASLLKNDRVPQIFNSYLVATDYNEVFTLIADLNENERVLAPDGCIFTADAFIKQKQSDNKILRAAQIKKLSEELTLQQETCTLFKASLEEHESAYEQAKRSNEELRHTLDKIKQEQQKVEISYQNVHFQHQQSAKRSEKLSTEIAQHAEKLDQEAMSLALLSDEVEDISIEVMQLEEAKNEALKESENVRSAQQQWHSQYTQLQSTLHELSMLIQQLRNSLQILLEQKRSKRQRVEDTVGKLELLQLEAEDLLMPQEQQEEKLQSMLAQQQDLRSVQADKQSELADIESQISELEKGQHSVVAQMDNIKSVIESQRIRAESASVRASSFIEQLAQLKQSLKDIVESLEEDSDEKQTQDELDKVTASVQRLGAVNLAAVDEYEEQSKRKDHLDAQNLDLSQALETLENAMRKIDKETRTRFKHTFDQVNSDLKSLFPKVFGGGMAYLALTDDDMLDTGVTIMARPPGKKNSTIHLLSGGEKALTALSLVFAIFRLNPAPFCLLDEVDAPLDDANVGRFCRLVSEMSESVQFIYITHNKVAMEMATHLTGVTMAEPGVSRMVAVDMEQALAIAE